MAKDTVVVADDDRTVVTMVSAFLRTKGFSVLPAFDAMQAMLAVRNGNPKAVVLDIAMPGGTGLEVIRKLKAMTKTNHIPLIVLTGSDDPKAADEVRELGADEFLKKPVDLASLHDALRKVLGQPAQPTDNP